MNNIIAQNRFGLGINPKENNTESLKLWFEKQFYSYEASPTIIASSPKTHEILHEAFLTNELKRKNPQDAKVKAQEKKLLRDLYFKEINNRFVISASTKTHFMERIVHFWANHFAISADKVQVRALAGAYENEAIRPNILGKFRDLFPHKDVWSADARQFIFGRWRDAARRDGFREYDGPPLEPLELYKLKSGEELVEHMFNLWTRANGPFRCGRR